MHVERGPLRDETVGQSKRNRHGDRMAVAHADHAGGNGVVRHRHLDAGDTAQRGEQALRELPARTKLMVSHAFNLRTAYDLLTRGRHLL